MIREYEIKIEPSILLMSILFLLLGGAFIVIWSVDIYFFLKIILSLSLIFYGIYILNRYYFLSCRSSIKKIHWSAPDGWSLTLNEGTLAVIPRALKYLLHSASCFSWAIPQIDASRETMVPAILENNSIFTSSIIILNFKIAERKTRSAILFLNSRNHADFRQLIRIGRQ